MHYLIVVILLFQFPQKLISSSDVPSSSTSKEINLLTIIENTYNAGFRDMDSDFVLNLTARDHDFNFPALSMFPDMIIANNAFIYIKFQTISTSFTILSIRDTNNSARFHIRKYEKRGQFNQHLLNIFYKPILPDRSEFKNETELPIPFINSMISLGVLVENKKITTYTSCSDLKHSSGYHQSQDTGPTNERLFDNGGILYLFNNGDITGNKDKFEGTVSEFVLSDKSQMIDLMCNEVTEGSGMVTKKWKSKNLGNYVITEETTTSSTSDATTSTTSKPKIHTTSTFSTVSQMEHSIISTEKSSRTKKPMSTTGIMKKSKLKDLKKNEYTQSKLSLITTKAPINSTSSVSTKITSTTSKLESTSSTKKFTTTTEDRTTTSTSFPTSTSTVQTSTLSSSAITATHISFLNKTNVKTSTESPGSNITASTAVTTERTTSTSKVSTKTTDTTKVPLVTTLEPTTTTRTKVPIIDSTKISSTTTSVKTPSILSKMSKFNTESITANSINPSHNISTNPTTPVDIHLNKTEISIRQPLSEIQNCKTDNIKGEKGLKGDMGSSGRNGSECDCFQYLRFNVSNKGDIGPKGETGEKGERGGKGEKGMTGQPGLHGTCSASQCNLNLPSKGIKGNKGEKGICSEDLCKASIRNIKGDKGDSGQSGTQGIKGERGDRAKMSDILSIVLPEVKLVLDDFLNKNIANLKGEPGVCSCPSNIIKEEEKLKMQTIVLNDAQKLKALSSSMPVGQMIFLVVENILLVKIDEIKNRWRPVKLENPESDWYFATDTQNSQSMPQNPAPISPTFNTAFKLMLIALPKPTGGDLRSDPYEPGAYSGSSYLCQKQAYNYGLGRAFYPLLNTDMFDFNYLLPEKYRYGVPVVNRRNEKIANSFADLLKSTMEIQANILDFRGDPIMSDTNHPCVWIGVKPTLYEDKSPTEDGLCLNWMSKSFKNSALVTVLKQNKPLLDPSQMKSKSCNNSCYILCMQIYPLMTEVRKR